MSVFGGKKNIKKDSNSKKAKAFSDAMIGDEEALEPHLKAA